MVKDMSRREEQRGTGTMFVWTAIVAIAVGVGLFVWFFVPGFSQPGHQQNAGIRTDQEKGISVTAQRTEPLKVTSPNSTGSYTVGRAEDVTAGAKPDLNMSQQQVSAIQSLAATHAKERVASVPFTIAIGAAVPAGTQLAALPPQLAQQFPGFKNDEYLIVGDQVLIVEKQTRRIVAIVPAQG
jgi:hypothetical protein